MKRNVTEYKQEEKAGFPIHNRQKRENTENNPEKPMTSEDYEKYGKFFRRGKESTKRRNAWKLRHFCNWIEMTPEHLIAEFEKAKEDNKLEAWEREQVNRISEFYNWILEQTNPRTGKNYSINYARSEASGIGAFHKQNTRALQGATSTFAPPKWLQTNTDSHRTI